MSLPSATAASMSRPKGEKLKSVTNVNLMTKATAWP